MDRASNRVPPGLPDPARDEPRRRWWRPPWRRVVAVALLLASACPFTFSCYRSWRTRNLNANESQAIATLKNLSSAQAQLQASGVVDCDHDGAGEYGFFAELCGAMPFRTDAAGHVGEARVAPPVFSAAFGEVRGGCVVRQGYVFQMFLPAPDGGWVAEADHGGSAGVAVDPARAATSWMCYAWPLEYGVTGQRSFFVNEGGDILVSKGAGVRYSDRVRPVPGRAAFQPLLECGKRKVAANTLDDVGDRWVVV